MTDDNDTARAVVLAALMVLSAFGGTVAFTGTATAVVGGVDITNGSVDPTIVQGSGAVQHTVSVDIADIEDDGTTDRIALDVAGGTVSSIDAVSSSNGDITAGISGGNVTLDPDGLSAPASTTLSVTVTVDWSGVADGDYDINATYTNGGTDGSTAGPATVATATVDSSATRATPGFGGGQVYPGAVVYRGEADIVFSGGLTETLTGVSGDAEGRVLEPPIPTDQPTGFYSTNGSRDAPGVTVQTPRVTDFEIRNENGEDVAGGSVGTADADDLTVTADYNFHNAEYLGIEVRHDGLDVTQAVLDDGQLAGKRPSSGDTVSWGIDLSDQAAGTYVFGVGGEDDLDFGQAVAAGTLELTRSDDVGIRLGTSSVTRGRDVTFEITGGVAGDTHLVRVSANDFRPNQADSDHARIFRNVADTDERGLVTGNASAGFNYYTSASAVPDGETIRYAYATVTIDDDGLGVGSLETQFLDTASMDVEVSDELDAGAYATSGSLSTDDASLTVDEGTVAIESPGDTYVVGSEVTLNGTAPASMNEVAIYARDEGEYSLVEVDGSETVPVDADGTFEAEDVAPSVGDEPGNQILSLPGTYRFGVIDASDANVDAGDSGPDATLTSQEFNSGTSSQRSLRVLDQDLAASYPSIIDGQIAEADADVDVAGSAPGANTVLFVAVGPRGRTTTRAVTVDEDDTFDEADISLSSLSRGTVSVHTYSAGRDGVVGDGDVPNGPNSGADLADLRNWIDGINTGGGSTLTADQVRSSILAETTEDTASDDELVGRTARIVDARTSITDVYRRSRGGSGINPVTAGETMVVEGTTNLQPGDNTIVAELEGEEMTVGLTSTEEWGTDGRWSATIDTGDAATGTYTLSVDDGENTVTADVRLVEQISTPTESPTPTETSARTAAPTRTATSASARTATPTRTPTPTEGGGPGFGAVVAVVALLVAALLANRRD